MAHDGIKLSLLRGGVNFADRFVFSNQIVVFYFALILLPPRFACVALPCRLLNIRALMVVD